MPLTAHVDATITNAEVPNATAPATVNQPATEARVPATPIATTSKVTKTAVPPEQEHVFLSVEVLPNKTAPSIDASSDDYVDAGEEYFIYYSPEPDRKPDAIDFETEDYVRHGIDANYEQRMMDRVLINHSPPPEFYERVTDEEPEQELQYDLHCEEDYVRRLSSGVTLGRPFPSDFAKREPSLRRSLRRSHAQHARTPSHALLRDSHETCRTSRN